MSQPAGAVTAFTWDAGCKVSIWRAAHLQCNSESVGDPPSVRSHCIGGDLSACVPAAAV
jgi:hypothetical protein